MRVRKAWALALVGATVLAGPAYAKTQGAVAAPIRQKVAVNTAPVNPVPDAGETDGSNVGPEAREAMAGGGSGEVAQVIAGSLDAQYAALQPTLGVAAAQAPASTAAAVLPMTASFTQSAPLLPAVAGGYGQTALPAADAAPEVAPAGPSVALARRVVESAEAFADYIGRASAVKADYTDAAGVSRAVARGGVYEAGQLDEGAIAYVALVALQDPEFVRSVDTLGRQGYHGALVQALSLSPQAVMQLPSSAAAAARAAKALGRMGSALMASGSAVKQSAYDIQHSAWSKTPAPTPAVMLAGLKARSAVREVMAADGGQAMLATLADLRTADGDGGSGRLTPVVAQGLTLAALAVLGEAGEEHTDRVADLLSDKESAQCLKMARLNLYQCLSVAGPNYEDVFCLGQHAMMETAQCVADASGWAAPARGVTVPVARPLSRSVMVPVALTTDAAPADAPVIGADPASAMLGDPNDATPPGAPPPMGAPGGYSMQVAGAGQR